MLLVKYLLRGEEIIVTLWDTKFWHNINYRWTKADGMKTVSFPSRIQ